MKTKNLGLTLIELLVVVAMAAVLALAAVPSFRDSIERAKLKAAVDEHIGHLYLAKTEALKTNRPVFYSMKAGAGQCYGFKTGSMCDCAQTVAAEVDMCTLMRVAVDPAIANMASTFAGTGTGYFEPVRATASSAGQLTWAAPSGQRLKTGVTSVGRVTVCTPTGPRAVPGYSNVGCGT